MAHTNLARGDIFTITTDEVPGTKERVGTTYTRDFQEIASLAISS